MGCTTLTVKAPAVTPPHVILNKYGFAEIEFANRMFNEPCEENDIIGSREAIGLNFTLENATLDGAKIRFTINYLRPGDTVKTSWSAIFTIRNGTFEKYIYSTNYKYIKGRYTGLTIGIDILK